MNRDDLIAFARRDWAGLERSKRQYWAERYRDAGSVAARTAAAVLFDHARRMGVDPLAAGARQADFDHHVTLQRQLDQAARAFTAR